VADILVVVAGLTVIVMPLEVALDGLAHVEEVITQVIICPVVKVVLE